jgi:glyoxylase-like metal-dependent hydrolase (beta-lactamase superfamily II)
MTLRIEAFPGGPFETNVYLVADLESGEALVIDAAQDTAETVRAAAAERGWTVGRSLSPTRIGTTSPMPSR